MQEIEIIHFDVDGEISPYLFGEKHEESIQQYNVTNPDSLKAVSIKSQSKITTDILNRYPKLALIITRTIGTDHIDISECKKRNIVVFHLLDYGAYAIAEHAFALLLTGCRRVVEAQKYIQKGIFSYKGLLGTTLCGKTLGVIGTGKIGLEVIIRAQAFGMKVISYDVSQNTHAAEKLGFDYVSLDELLMRSDCISLHAPYTKETHHLINEQTIQKMKDQVILINTARGGLVDTSALIKNIKKFHFIGLDVLEDEQSFTKLHPLLRCDNVILTPHIAFYTDETIKRIGKETMECVTRFTANDNTGRVV